MSSPGPNGTPPRAVRPFLHPTISRLRSFVPQPPTRRMASASSFGTFQSYSQDVMSPSPSHFSALSRTASVSDLNAASSQQSAEESEREAFRWTTLMNLGEYIYSKNADKANAILGSPSPGTPTVLTANGLICIGTDAGRVFVFDFKQQLKCICGDESSGIPLLY